MSLKRTLAVDLGAGLVLPTPVMVASGCAGTGRELSGLVDLRRVGRPRHPRASRWKPRKGSPPPRIAETPSGTVWTTGLQNPGIHAFVDAELPRLARGGAPVIVSVAGGSLEEYVRLIGALQTRPEVAAIELHLSGPDEELRRRRPGGARRPDRRDRGRGGAHVAGAGLREAPDLGIGPPGARPGGACGRGRTA